jgi:hypothetical protein
MMVQTNIAKNVPVALTNRGSVLRKMGRYTEVGR